MGANDTFAKLPHIGESVRRKEDYRFLTGNGQYTDDINLPNQRYAVFVRSPHAHANIRSIDSSRAAAMPGVARIFTGQDIAGKMNGLPCGWLITSTDGTPMKEPPHPVLAQGKVRYVGDHHGDLVAHVAHLALREHRVGRLLHRLPVGRGDQPAAGQPVHLAFDVLAREDFRHARHGFGALHVHLAKGGVRVRRPHEHRVPLVRQVDVVGVLAGAGEEAHVLLAADGFADVRQLGEIGCTHVVLLFRASWPRRPGGPR